MKKIIAIIICVAMFTTQFSIGAFAANSDNNNKVKNIVTYEDLPDGLREVISEDAIIYQNEDGTYDIYQDEPIRKNNKVRAQWFSAPNGGSYKDLENYQLTYNTSILYITYLPREKVNDWFVEKIPGLRDYIKSQIATYGLSQVNTIVANVLATYGLNFTPLAIYNVYSNVKMILDFLKIERVSSASDRGNYGIQVESIVTTGVGFSKVYSRWSDVYVTTTPYGGSATWCPGEYLVTP